MAHDRRDADDASARTRACSGLTLIELLVVVAVIVAIAALALPALTGVQARGRISACENMVKAIASAIASYPRREISVPSLGEPAIRDGQVRRLWDFEAARDGILDGDPDLDEAFTEIDRKAARNVGYRGFLGMTGTALEARSIDPAGRVIDPWGRPLRIAFAADAYGAAWFGLWSTGPNGTDGDGDDVRSWK